MEGGLLPLLIMHIIRLDLASAFERAREPVLSPMTDGDHANRSNSSGNAQGLAQDRIGIWIGQPGKASRQTLIHHAQQQDHDGTANVHVPVGDRPDYLVALFINFIRLLITLVVGSFTGARDDQNGSLGNKWVESALNI